MMQGVIITPQLRIQNSNGDIVRGMKVSDPGFVGFGEAYFSIINFGSIKGWKRHRSATLNLLVPVGQIRFIIYDDRTGSSTEGMFSEHTLGNINNSRLTISPGLWVAFTGLGRDLNMLLNISSEEHEPREADSIGLDSIPYDWTKELYE